MGTPTLGEQAAFYDERWLEFSYANRLRLRRTVAILGELHALRVSTPSIIDLGCGAGWFTSIVGHFGPTLGVDLSPKAVEAARLRYPHVRFEAADLSVWHTDERFDVVTSQEVLEHFTDEHQLRHFELIERLLVPGGHLILTTPNASSFAAMPAISRETWSEQPIENWVTRSTLRSLAEHVGLSNLRLTTIIPDYPVESAARKGLLHIRSIARRTGLGRQWATVCERAGLGLHLAMVAQKPNNR